MMSVPSIIDDLGGVTAVARSVGVGVSTASEWKRAGSIPVKYWPPLLGLARDKGVSLDEKAMLRAHVGETSTEQAPS